MTHRPLLGLAANWRQFALLVVVNALVGGTIGLERSIIPSLAKQDCGLDSYRAVLSFIVAFGVAKAVANYTAGLLADRVGRSVEPGRGQEHERNQACCAGQDGGGEHGAAGAADP